MSFVAPPKHDPVVIKLGKDSDSDESDASDTESAKKSPSNKKNSAGGGLFGGLEMMIKEARKSAEVTNYSVLKPGIPLDNGLGLWFQSQSSWVPIVQCKFHL